MRRVAQRRLASNTNSNRTNTASFDQFILRMGSDEFDPSQALPHSVLTKTVETKIVFFKK
jgi:hypothetical protein